MDFSYSHEFVTLIQNMVLQPDFSSSVTFFWFSLINELVAVHPYVFLISGQIIFLEGSINPSILSELFVYIALPAGLGGALGSTFLYSIAYIGGKPAINKHQKYLRFSWEDVENITKRFDGTWTGDLLFILIRSIPILPSLPVNLAAGFVRMHPLLYVLYTFIGFVVRLMIMFIFLSISASVLAY